MVPLVRWEVGELCASVLDPGLCHPGVVDEHIDLPQRALDLRDQRLDLVAAGEVGDHRVAPDPGFGELGPALMDPFARRRHRDRGAIFTQGPRGREPDPGRAACPAHEADPPGERQVGGGGAGVAHRFTAGRPAGPPT